MKKPDMKSDGSECLVTSLWGSALSISRGRTGPALGLIDRAAQRDTVLAVHVRVYCLNAFPWLKGMSHTALRPPLPLFPFLPPSLRPPTPYQPSGRSLPPFGEFYHQQCSVRAAKPGRIPGELKYGFQRKPAEGAGRRAVEYLTEGPREPEEEEVEERGWVMTLASVYGRELVFWLRWKLRLEAGGEMRGIWWRWLSEIGNRIVNIKRHVGGEESVCGCIPQWSSALSLRPFIVRDELY